MKAMVVFAHPCPESFGAALHTKVVETLSDRGWDVDDCDLNAEGFQPVLTEEERRNYHEEPGNIEPVRNYVERLRAADALVFSFPVWNFGYPAILKGFFDRVFLPGVSFKLVDGKVRPNLTHIKKLAAVTTYGGNRMRAMICGDPPRKHFTRSVRYVMQPETMRYLALYDMNLATDEKRGAFLDKVERDMRALL
ncbi:NAD(P)H-dependent oxidoreductase [Rhodobacteraceae bacterium]|nr:NAD(P)H-dependent oxidoreductase [Paracoccaceae bacterium]